MTIRERFNVWITSPDIRIGGHGPVDCFRAGYLAALEAAAQTCEDKARHYQRLAMPSDESVCDDCAAAVRALGG